MSITEIYESLCHYDKRNPSGTQDDDEVADHKQSLLKDKRCFCDNCFYGRTKLAEELLKYLPESK